MELNTFRTILAFFKMYNSRTLHLIPLNEASRHALKMLLFITNVGFKVL